VWLAVMLALAAPFQPSRAELESMVVDAEGRARRDAVIGYAKLDTLETWEKVVAALRDPKPEVADEAQLQLAALEGPKELALLYGKDALGSKDDFVRLRCAEVLGRLAGPPDAVALGKALADKDAGVRRTAAWSLERQKTAGNWAGAAPAELAELAKKDKSPEVRAAALAALATCGGLDAAALAGFATDASAEVRAACVVASRALGAEVAFVRASAAAKDASLGVRLCAAESFAAGRDARGAIALVDQLEAEKELRGRWRLVELLRELSGLAHRLDPRPWRAWAAALADGPLPEVRKADAGEEERSATFAGLPIRSERVTFLIDLSGSIWQKRADGRTRKQVLDEELGRALRSLPPSTRFNLIPYTATPVPWQKGLVAADEKNVAKALEWFTGRKDTGVGDFWGALEVALADPDADTLVVLTDGAPSGGRRWNLGLMKRLFAERNRFRRIEVDAVLADASGRLQRDWDELCGSSGGRTVEYSLR
jgi:HEAT repeat protein